MRKHKTKHKVVQLFAAQSSCIIGKNLTVPEISDAMDISNSSLRYILSFLHIKHGPTLLSRREGRAESGHIQHIWTLKREVTIKDFEGYPGTSSTAFAAWRRKKEAEAEKKLKQAHGGFSIKDDPLADPPGPLFDVVPGKVIEYNPENDPFVKIMKAIKQSEAAILCHMDKMDERELKRFRILEEMLAHIASTAERWAEIESRLGKLALSAGRIPALESKVAILTEEIRKARREVGFMNPKLDKLCKEWGG